MFSSHGWGCFQNPSRCFKTRPIIKPRLTCPFITQLTSPAPNSANPYSNLARSRNRLHRRARHCPATADLFAKKLPSALRSWVSPCRCAVLFGGRARHYPLRATRARGSSQSSAWWSPPGSPHALRSSARIIVPVMVWSQHARKICRIQRLPPVGSNIPILAVILVPITIPNF